MTIQNHYGNWLMGATGEVVNECCCSSTTGASPCSGNCDGTNCPGSEPSVRLCIFDADYMGSSITWCNEVWTEAQVQAGDTRCVCPTSYTAPYQSGTTNSFDVGHKWAHDTTAESLNLNRDGHTVGFPVVGSFGNGIIAKGTGVMWNVRAGLSYTWLNSQNVPASFTAIDSLGPATFSSYKLVNNFFDWAVVVSGVQYSIARGDNWP